MEGGWPGFESQAAVWRRRARRLTVNANEEDTESGKAKERERETQSLANLLIKQMFSLIGKSKNTPNKLLKML